VAGWIPALVQAGLQRCTGQRVLASGMPDTSADARAARADRLADIAEREARWWTVLARWTYAQGYLPGGVRCVRACGAQDHR